MKKKVGIAELKRQMNKILEASGMSPEAQSKIHKMVHAINKMGGEPNMTCFQRLAKKLVKIMGMDACDKFYGWLQSLEKCLFVELVIAREQHMAKWVKKQAKLGNIKTSEYL